MIGSILSLGISSGYKHKKDSKIQKVVETTDLTKELLDKEFNRLQEDLLILKTNSTTK